MLLNDAKALYLGSTPLDAVYLGSEKVWPTIVAFDPTQLPGLTLWLDAATLAPGPTEPIAAWPDRSGQARTVNLVATEAPPTIAAVLKNGHKVVRFAYAEARLRVPSVGADKDFTLAYVARMWGTFPSRVVSSSYPPANVLFGWWNGQQDAAYAGGFLTPDTKVTQTTDWKLYSADGASSPAYTPRLFSNGVFLTGDGLANTTDGWQDAFNISGYDATGSNESADCEVAEVILYNRKLSDADRQQVEVYLRTKWGMS